MLYQLCPVCGGTGSFWVGSGEDAEKFSCPTCAAVRVTETGLSVAQAEAAVERAQLYERALRDIAEGRTCGDGDEYSTLPTSRDHAREALDSMGRAQK